MNVEIYPVPWDYLDDVITGLEMEDAAKQIMLQYSRASAHVWTVHIDDWLVCVFGLIPKTMVEQSAYLWVYVTPELNNHRFIYARYSREVVVEMLKQYPTIIGHCETKNKSAQRWLRWLGATFSEPEGQLIPFKLVANG